MRWQVGTARVLLAAFGVVAVSATGASAQAMKACYEATLTTDNAKVLATCSKAIDAGDLGKKDLSHVYSNRGLGYLRKKDYDRSIKDFDEAIRLDGKNPFPYDNRGDAYREKGQFDRAVADYNAAIRVDASFASAYLNRALAYERLGNLTSARADLQAVLQMKGDREIDKWARAEATRHTKRLDEAQAKKP